MKFHILETKNGARAFYGHAKMKVFAGGYGYDQMGAVLHSLILKLTGKNIHQAGLQQQLIEAQKQGLALKLLYSGVASGGFRFWVFEIPDEQINEEELEKLY